MPQITLDGTVLPSDLLWKDEFQWSSQTKQIDYSLSGALLVQSAIKLSGRPITLMGDWAWVTRSIVDTLSAKESSAGATYTLVLADGRNYSVIFADGGFVADPVYHIDLPDGNHPYKITLKLITA